MPLSLSIQQIYMDEDEGFDEIPKHQLIDFNYKPIIHIFKRQSNRSNHNNTLLNFRQSIQGEDAKQILSKQGQYVVYTGDGINRNKQNNVQFQAQFQSSNLELVIKKKYLEYELYLRPDTNTISHFQWFYFKMKVFKTPKNITMTIKNLTKSKMLYSSGLKIFHKVANQPYFSQISSNVLYYQNISDQSYSLKFSYQFVKDGEQVQFCSQPPYTYNKLIYQLQYINHPYKSLCKSLMGKKVPYLHLNSNNKSKAIVFVIARQHPGQSVGSWMIHGLIQQLKNNNFGQLQWIVIPMFCVDGVILGNNRTGLSGLDFNRYWSNQQLSKKQKLLPEIVYFLNLVKNVRKNNPKKPRLFIDLHGHSSQPNIFTYGPPHQANNQNYLLSRAFPQILSKNDSNFCLQQCSYTIKADKKNTIRNYLFSYFQIPFVYTIQASFGIMRQKLVNQLEFIKFGHNLHKSIIQFIKGCVLGEQPKQIAFLFQKIKQRNTQQPDQYDSDEDICINKKRKMSFSQKKPKLQRPRFHTQIQNHISSSTDNNCAFNIFRAQNTLRISKNIDKQKKRINTQVNLSRSKGQILPKIKKTLKTNNLQSLPKLQSKNIQNTIINISQVNKQLYRIRNSRIGKKILIINAYNQLQ